MSVTRIATTHDNPFVIPNPTLGFINFLGEAGRPFMEKDIASLRDIFASVQVADRNMPPCNVLFLYCTLEPSGRLPGARFSYRDVIAAAGAHVAVLASELPPALASDGGFARLPHAWPANIVITLARNGDCFGAFFRQLFLLMRSGKSMPMAWVELAPQGPVQRTDIPATLCLLEAGHIAFGQKRAGPSSDIRLTPADRI
jgi:hypothetical protein